MVVDDSSLLRQMYNMVLAQYQCTIVQASNGKEALELLAGNPDVQLIILDINMPILNGLGVLAKIKEEGVHTHIPVIIVSTEGKEEDTLRALSLGARGYVKKPFRPPEIHSLIQKIFAV
jgi:two-component system chemotaxis response regulator CheY